MTRPTAMANMAEDAETISLHESTNGRIVQTSTEDNRVSPRYQALLLLSGFLMIFHVIGINQTYGVFQEYYTSSESHVKGAQGQDALVSLVGTIGSGLTWSGSIFVNPLIARFQNVKIISLAGAFIMSAGLFLASYSNQLWQLYLTQALLYGLGSSMYYFPLMSIAPVYFDRRRAFAMGFVLAGSGVGGLVMAPVQQTLLDKYGPQWTLRIIAIWNFAVAIPVCSVIRHRPGFRLQDRANNRMNTRLATRGTFLYQAFGSFFQAAGNIVPLYYITSYSVTVLSYSRNTGSTLLAVNSAVNSVSRVGMGLIADLVGRQNTLIVGVILSGASVFALWYDAARPRFIGFVVLYGIYAGGYNALLPTTITEIYGVEHYSSVNAIIYFIRGLGSIVGAPLAGIILGSQRGATEMNTDLDALQKRYNDVVIYAGIMLFCAAFCVSYVRWLDARDKGQWKWKA